ncbi:MAG: EamA family transporter [Betaproteobacteria bacterium]|jgi:O-acetylserine/cysteine efflux transporter|uniref:Putative amino-acid metabolite efflux pump n=1 Tax=Thiomonas delicata TaxID=364030 RepID=A0A238D7V5_THIDL|nr:MULTISPECIES: EamA family transporter [Thiomonas]MDE2130223.1 EamA family transporter [Betaproteobacteria bacterium]SBP89301.1 putative amino-acid metabolite efflux pump [Thiomonas delicata]
MRPRHALLALLVVTIWGFNFVVIEIGLQGLPPLLFTSLRFFFAAVPLVFFVSRPATDWRLLVGWGLAQFAVQFALLFVGMKLGMPAGLSSLVIQLQAFFTIGLAWWLMGEHARPMQLLGAGIALAGMGIVAWHLDTPGTLVGLLLVIGAAMSWATANILTKRIGAVEPLALVAWGSLVAVPPLLLVSAVVEGPHAMLAAVQAMNLKSWLTVLFQSYPNTLLGFGVWSMLMRRYPAAQVAPFSLLVPVAGMVSAALVLHEALEPWKIMAGLLVLGGLALNQFAARLQLWLRQRAAT